MKSTGIVRRIDDLGRVVIPKEIRHTMGVLEGDALEIVIDIEENMICFRKYNKHNSLEDDILHLQNRMRIESYKKEDIDRWIHTLDKIRFEINKENKKNEPTS